MNKESKKFPAVMTTKEVLGIEEGTVLAFDFASGKYVSIVEEEVIADDYFYSGSAIALDPYIVKDNIGTYFVHIEQEGDSEKEEVETTLTTTSDDIKPEPAYQEPEPYDKVHALVIDCGCGHRTLLHTIPAPGVNITLMAEDEKSFLELTCKECGSTMKLHFEQNLINVDESTEEESK